MNYNHIPFDTGDIILFHGKPRTCGKSIFSCLISKCTCSKYTHAGIVIRDPTFASRPLRGLYIMESVGFENIPDVENNQKKFGVQLRNLYDVLSSYEGKVYWRQLICERTNNFYKELAAAHSIVHNKPYDFGMGYVKALFDLRIGDVQKNDEFFCSSLVAFLYVVWNFLPVHTPWSIVTPKDLSTENGRKIKLEWSNCQLCNECEVLF